jgi:SAM-dependent methyltransferase
LLKILRLVLAIMLAAWVLRQVRKPSGWLGRRVVRGMNLSHATMTDWGLKQLMVAKNAAILDVGCGGGRTVQRLATLASEGLVIGLDYSAASAAVARITNANEIEAGRVLLHIPEPCLRRPMGWSRVFCHGDVATAQFTVEAESRTVSSECGSLDIDQAVA